MLGVGQAYKINNLHYVELNYQKLIRGVSTPYEFLVPRSINYFILVMNKNLVHCNC